MVFSFSIGGPTNELRPFTEGNGTNMGYTTDSAILLIGIRPIPSWQSVLVSSHSVLKRYSMSVQEEELVQLWQVYLTTGLFGEVVRFQHRRTN